MRFYAKLMLMTLVFASLQRFAPPSRWGGELWFGMRCHIANVLNDERLQAQMVDEHYQRRHTADDEANLNIAVEIEYCRAVAEEASERESAARAVVTDDAAAWFDDAAWPG